MNFCHVRPFCLSGIWTPRRPEPSSAAPLWGWVRCELRTAYRVPSRPLTSLDAGASVPLSLCPLSPAVQPSSTHLVYPRHPRRRCSSQTSAGIGDNLPCHLEGGRGSGETPDGSCLSTSPRYAPSHAGLAESMTMVFTERPSQHRSPPNHARQHLSFHDRLHGICSRRMDSTTRALSSPTLPVTCSLLGCHRCIPSAAKEDIVMEAPETVIYLRHSGQ